MVHSGSGPRKGNSPIRSRDGDLDQIEKWIANHIRPR
jgi:hypothetical protein